MSIQKQFVLTNPRFMAAMKTMYWYCVKQTCEECPYSTKQDGRLACAFSARSMQDAFTTLQSQNELQPNQRTRKNANRRNGKQHKDVALNIRITATDKQMLAEVSTLQGVSVSELFRMFVKDAHASTYARLSDKTYKVRKGDNEAGLSTEEGDTPQT